jgi:Fic family protein
MNFAPRFTVTHPITAALTRIERARGFLEAANLSEDWIRRMGERALVLEAHHTTHIEGTRLTLEQSERLLAGEAVPEADPDDARELLNYRDAFEFVSAYVGHGGPITGGLILFTDGLATQHDEVKARGERAIRHDLLVRAHRLSDRQALALDRVLDQGRITIGNFATLCPGVNRRTLQRDLRDMVEKGLLATVGRTNNLEYVAGKGSSLNLRQAHDTSCAMSPEISERSFEEAIECALLRYGPDACVGEATAVHETSPPYGDTPPGGYRQRKPEGYDRCASCRATWWTSCSPRSRRNGRSSSSTMARRYASSS